MEAIKLTNLNKQYNKKKVLNDLNLAIHQNEVFGLIGRNGAGKSTLLHTISGIIHKTSGNISVFNYKNIENIKKEIGVMPDASNLYPNLNAIDFLKYMGGIKKVKYSTNDYWTVLEKVGLNNVKDKKLKDFSFGMKKKISIAQAILGDPSLIILDEPTSGLDPESSIKIRKLILNLKQQGKTIFLTSHNFEEIEEICDRLAIMNNGQIAKMGTIDELKDSTNEIKIQIKTLKKLASNQLYDIKNILKDNSQTLEIQEDNLFCIEVSSINEIPKIISILTENNIEIIEVTQQRSSLQDIFMSI